MPDPRALLLALLLCAGTALAADPLTYGTKAQQLITKGDFVQALEELKAATSRFPYDEGLRRQLAFTYTELAKRDLQSGRFAQAAENFGQASELLPDSKELVLMRGIALYLNKDYAAARDELLQAGEGSEPLVYLGKISYDTGDLPGALDLWRRAKEQDPANKALAGLIEKAERELPVESRMDKGYSSMFDLSFDAELPPGLSAEVLDALESAYNTVGSDLGVFPTARIPVLLYTKKDYRSVTAGPDWSGGLYDGKIRVPVGGLTELTPQLRAIIFHEFTHVLVAELTHGNIPTWFNEGLAEIEGRKLFAPKLPPLNAAQEKHLLPLAELSSGFSGMGGGQAWMAYQQSYAMTSFMVQRYGWYSVQEILKYLGQRADMNTAVSKALADYALDLNGVMREWRESLPSAGAGGGSQ
ncbi:tetratricopeptide repeat protein [Geomonas nitrogeniifigens]|uniref:Tetratricopeptide repeat protein n=1 Tax=Geomonas diazotrophica TaxID=2843197 RepID=A0ABX8JD09_9BACT|nr:tetratricopeptide repeat protein [Geomonas nitrogeniifigens]QWV96295.1 tetratricopeptide repeat protein [Geomonas nitrogeniifigens]